MRSLSVVLFLLATCIVSTRADDSFTSVRDGVVTTTPTTTSTSASSTASSSTSTLQFSAAPSTSTSTSASASSTSSTATYTFQWDGAEIAALVVLLSFIVFGTAFITTWQVRRMLAMRRDNAGFGAYTKHEGNPCVDAEVTDTDAVMAMNQRTQHLPENLRSFFNNTNNDLERQPAGLPAASFRSSTPDIPDPSILISPANSPRHSKAPSPYSEAVLRPPSQNPLRRLFSFEDIPQSTDPGLLAERVDRRST